MFKTSNVNFMNINSTLKMSYGIYDIGKIKTIGESELV